VNQRPRRPDLLGPAALVLAGLVLLAVAWAGASAQELVGAQLTYVNLGVGGVVLCGTGNAVYLLGLRRAVRERRAGLDAHPRFRSEATR
jgi:drug/metabolite transporter (DMT)-like permease